MRNLALAEWTLSLVTTPDRAAASVGDLLEERTGPVAFWWSIASTAVSLSLSDLSAAPLSLLGFALYGLVIAIVLSVLLGGLAGLLFAVLLAARPGLTVTQLTIVGTALSWIGSYAAGMLLAQRAKGRELAACVVLLLLQTVAIVVTAAVSRPPDPAVAGWYSTFLGTTITFSISQLLTLAGSIQIRRRRLRAI
jgi:hypothetical protein